MFVHEEKTAVNGVDKKNEAGRGKKSISKMRPVSQKAYDGFIMRIKSVAFSYYERQAMIEALDRYLDGEKGNYCRGLSREFVMVFEMLRFEVDAAISRSEKARARRRNVNEKGEVAKIHQKANSATGDNRAIAEDKPINEYRAVAEPKVEVTNVMAEGEATFVEVNEVKAKKEISGKTKVDAVEKGNGETVCSEPHAKGVSNKLWPTPDAESQESTTICESKPNTMTGMDRWRSKNYFLR